MPLGNKNLKDSEKDSIKDTVSMPAPYEAKGFRSGSVTMSYTKTNKLITALYMVTDIVEKGEPIRNKLRHLGVEIISDIHSIPSEANKKIAETMSFLNIALAMNLISEMNYGILKKEFLELSQCIKDSTQTEPTWLEEFLLKPYSTEEEKQQGSQLSYIMMKAATQHSIGHDKTKGHKIHTRIGVQKGSTLMKVLSDKTSFLSDKNSNSNATKNGFDVLKNQRRNQIISIIKNNNGGMAIKDIKTKINNETRVGVLYSEKTLQRELISMVKDGVLNKTGEKRWSRYFVKN